MNATRSQRSSTRGLRTKTNIDHPRPLAATSAQQAAALGSTMTDSEEADQALMPNDFQDLPPWLRQLTLLRTKSR